MSMYSMWMNKTKQNPIVPLDFLFFCFIYSLKKYCNFGYNVMTQKQFSSLLSACVEAF